MPIEITDATAAELVGIRGALGLLADGSPSFVRDVFTQAQFIAANAESGAITIRLCADITLPTGTTTIAAGKIVEFNAFKFVSTEGAGLFFYGLCAAERRQIFSGFSAGSIRGTFGRESIFPEWWGLETGRHDIAINAAIQASGLLFSNTGLVVSLAAGVYSVARPIDLAGTACRLQGAGSNRTYLRATSAWTADTWLQSEVWGDAEEDAPNHAALIWMGGGQASPYTYRTQVIGMEIECYEATLAHWDDYRISGISAKGGVEENSQIDDVSITNSSGFGIGFCRHKYDGNYLSPTVNGISLTNYWITGPTKRDAYPIYLSQWVNNFRASVGTIDVGLAKSLSSDWDEAPADDEPAQVFDYPHFAVVAQGSASIENLHVEGPIIGVFCKRSSGESNINLTDIKFLGLMDRSAGAVYAEDGLGNTDPTANTDYYGKSCGVLIAGFGEGTAEHETNWADRVVCKNLKVIGSCQYAIRDDIYGIHRQAYGTGASPAQNTITIASYERGNIYVRATTSPYALIGGGTYNKAAPQTDRVYFLGPVY